MTAMADAGPPGFSYAAPIAASVVRYDRYGNRSVVEREAPYERNAVSAEARSSPIDNMIGSMEDAHKLAKLLVQNQGSLKAATPEEARVTAQKLLQEYLVKVSAVPGGEMDGDALAMQRHSSGQDTPPMSSGSSSRGGYDPRQTSHSSPATPATLDNSSREFATATPPVLRALGQEGSQGNLIHTDGGPQQQQQPRSAPSTALCVDPCSPLLGLVAERKMQIESLSHERMKAALLLQSVPRGGCAKVGEAVAPVVPPALQQVAARPPPAAHVAPLHPAPRKRREGPKKQKQRALEERKNKRVSNRTLEDLLVRQLSITMEESTFVETVAGDSDDGEVDLQERAVGLHNQQRARFGVPGVRSNKILVENARKHAELCAENGQISYALTPTEGQNVFQLNGAFTTHLAEEEIIEQAVSYWVAEEAQYRAAGGGAAGIRSAPHFTQMIWKASTEIGIAVSKSRHKAFVVCNYSPRGNKLQDTVVWSNVRVSLDKPQP